MRRSMSSRALIRAAAVLAAATVLAALAAPACIVDWTDDCGHDLGYPGCKGAAAASAGTGAGGSTSTGMTGGGGSASMCTDASTCPPVPAGPCAALGTSACVHGKCTLTYTAGDAPSQKYGSCKQNLCAADGGFSTVNDAGNAFDDGNPCTPGTCANGVPLNTPMLGATCLFPSLVQGICEQNPDPTNPGSTLCAACDPASTTACSTTPGLLCIGGQCVPSHCNDTTTDNGETDLNCGGGLCLPCDTGQVCVQPRDCFSNVCTGGTCQAPSCTDNIQNGTETDVDCGGLCPQKCAATLKCLKPSDCTSGVCAPSSPDAGLVPDQCQAPTCTDGVKNGSETMVDCGNDGSDAGPACPPCATAM